MKDVKVKIGVCSHTHKQVIQEWEEDRKDWLCIHGDDEEEDQRLIDAYIVDRAKNPVQIKSIEEPIVSLCAPDHSLVGTIDNMLQFMDVRIQIMRQKLDGYYVILKGEKIYLKKDSTVGEPPYPKGLFDIYEKMVYELAGIGEEYDK